MMIRRLLPLIPMLLAASLVAHAVQWEEIGWTATVVSDHDTGLPAIVFNTGLAYDQAPDRMRLRITWEVFSIDGGTEPMLYEYTKTTTARKGTQRIFSASQSVLIEQGTQYGARVWIDDIENGLSYHRSFSYFAPRTLMVGLRLAFWDGSEEADIAAMSDQDLQRLVSLGQTLAGYEVLGENISIDSFFSQVAAASDRYPVCVILLPDTGVTNNWGTESQSIIVTFGLKLLEFAVPTSADRADFQQQIELYDQEFVGTAYAGTQGDGFGHATVVFVHDAMGLVLEAAEEELAARSR